MSSVFKNNESFPYVGSPTNNSEVRQLTPVDLTSICITALICVVTFGGNVVTVVAVYRTPKLRTVPNLYVISLAVADILAAITMLYQTVKYFPDLEPQFDSNMFLCLTRHALLVTSIMASVFSLTLISVDRLVFIRWPLHYDRLVNFRRASTSIGLSWMLSVVFGTISLYHNTWSSASQCTMFEVFTIHHHVYVAMPLFLICCLVIGGCYSYILSIALRHRRAMGSWNSGSSGVISRLEQTWSVARMFMLVFGTFVACWTPAMVGLIIGHTSGIPVRVMHFLIPLGVTNSGMNFVIYAVCNRDFREAFRNMFCWK